MKIAHIVCTFPPYKGGIGKSALDFSEMMAVNGHEVDVYTPAYIKTQTSLNHGYHKNLKIKRLKPFLSLGNGAFIPSLFFKLKKYDIIYLHYPFFGGAEIVWFFKLFNRSTKLIIHYHMDVVGLSFFARILSLPSRIIRNSLFRRANLFTVASFDYIENSLLRKFFIKNKEKFRETFFPVDTDVFLPSYSPRDNKIKKILFVGGLDKAHYFKGLKVLLRSLSTLKERGDWELVIIGEGNLKSEYIEFSKEMKIDSKVSFVGLLNGKEFFEAYSSSDFFILPSINQGEAFGIVLIEAMASGLPVIASSLPGVRAVFTEKEGFKVKPGDTDDLKNKIEIFLNNNDLLEDMSKNARILAMEKYSWNKISKNLNSIINEL